MPSWNELLRALEKQPAEWLDRKLRKALTEISKLRKGRNVLFYASGWLQKGQAPGVSLQLTHEDLNGFMSVLVGMKWDAGLTLLLHTPGGVTNAAETIVSYLRSKFADIEVVVPALAMSAGTMMALGADRILMGRQSQLGPIDPQMPLAGRFVPAFAVVQQFQGARADILQNPAAAHAWAPILQSIGPAALQEAFNAIEYSKRMVAGWLRERTFAGQPDAEAKAEAAATFFADANVHMSHGRRIDANAARSQGLTVDMIEDDQSLQDAVLTAYHLMTMVFEKSMATKVIVSGVGRQWVKNWIPPSPKA